MRQRRLRATPAIRESHVEVRFTKDQLVYPLFIIEKENYTKEISSMPGIFQFSPDQVANEVAYLVDKGIQNFILFGIPNTKDFEGKEAANPKGPVCTATRLLKDNFGKSITLYADVCLCEYTTHGHCGIPDSKGTIQNDSSLPVLANAAVAYAEAGADWVAPSNMMDERVISIREQLDLAGLSDIRILSYAAKYASSYYGPFRDAAESPPEFGDRKSYQIDFRTIQQGLNEIQNDEMQGADAVMVKPALAYLDMITRARNITSLPLYTYNVSGEYSMVKFGARQGLFNEEQIVMENLYSMFRAGSDLVITYHAKDIVSQDWLT